MGIIYTQHYFSLLNTASLLKTNMSSQSHILVISDTNMHTHSMSTPILKNAQGLTQRLPHQLCERLNAEQSLSKYFPVEKKLEMYVHN